MVKYIKKITIKDRELTEAATIRKFRIVQIEGSRQVNRKTYGVRDLMQNRGSKGKN